MKTTVNIMLSELPKLIEACEKCHKKHYELINRCMRKFFASHPQCLDDERSFRTVEYQPKGAGYLIVSMVFDSDVFNLGVFFRAFCRVSVSAMVTTAIARFLDEVVREIEGKKEVTHNYVDYHLLMRHNEEKNMPEWTINWLFEEEKTKKKTKRE